MRECTVDEGGANRIRATACVLSIAVLVALGAAGTGPAAAADFEVGEVRARVDTSVSAGVSMRVQDRDCELIHVSNGGCAESQVFLNSDDGDLNYDKWDVFANTYKATVDVDLAWKNFGAFFRGTVFYDPVAMYVDTDRTDLDRDARYRSSPINSGVVGMGYQLLDAYVYGSFEVAGRPVDIRIGNQVLSWGESLFYQAGVSSINTVDLNRLRAPGSDLKEAFLPAPMLRVSAEIFRNFSVEAFYQFAWNYTQLDPVGSYFSTKDIIGRAAEGSFVHYDPGIEDKYFEQVTRRLANEPEPTWVVGSVIASAMSSGNLPPEALVESPHMLLYDNTGKVYRPTSRYFPRTAEEQFERGYTPIAPFAFFTTPDMARTPLEAFGLQLHYLLAGNYPASINRLSPFMPFAIPRLKDEWASSQGQWGIALRYFVERIRTEFGAYYLRVHDKVPSVGWQVEPADLIVRTYLMPEYFAPEFVGCAFPGCQTPESLLRPQETTYIPNAVAIPTGYFREYPEDINVFGVSAATELFGVAWGFEASYKTRNPIPVNGELLLRDLILEVTETGVLTRRSGFVREKRLQVQLNAIATWGPGDPYIGALVRALHISSIATTFEVAAVEFPSLDDDVAYQPTDGGHPVEELSWGYQTLVQGFYDNPFGVPITVVPRVSFAHDVDGNTPGFYPFIENRKSFSAGVNVDYLGVWQFDLSYTNFFGAGDDNGLNDRDYVSFSVTHSF